MTNVSSLEAIFFAALEKRSAADRAAYLDEACAGDADLRQRIEKILAAQGQAGSFLEHPAIAANPVPTIDQPHSEATGDTIGPYKLLEVIGEGGFGVVYLAEQSEPVRRKVALKILKPGMDSKQVVARFEAERQALAIMDHPNIARVFDGGTVPLRIADIGLQIEATSNRAPASSNSQSAISNPQLGRPYFVMEYVKGVPITQFCDEQKLTPRQRLELFVNVCQAVQHAHQKGIIHRDIKPSNVLVSRHDTVPVVKVIDFGVAKAVGQSLTDKTVFTAIAQMIGTPLYMSPEQAGMSDLDVDTRSDIYSLGVLLYELLTGTTPFSKDRFKQAAYDEIRRIIREEEPPKPSTRLSELSSPHAPRAQPNGHVTRSVTATLASVSALRHTEPAKLTKLVRGELDWIVMKALEKDRNRRYETANGFAMDVQRYLADEAVLACPPSAGYRLRKFVRRNKGALTLAGVAALALAIGIALIWRELWWTWASDKAQIQALAAEAQQSRRAQNNLTIALDALERMYTDLAQGYLSERPDLKPLQREFLQRALAFYEKFAAENAVEPSVRLETAKALRRVAVIQHEFGERDKCAAALQPAIALAELLAQDRETSLDGALLWAGCLSDLSSVHRESGKLSEAEAVLKSALGALGKHHAEVNRRHEVLSARATCFGNLGIVYRRLGRLTEANEAHGEAVAMRRELATTAEPYRRFQLAQYLVNLGASWNDLYVERGQQKRPNAEDAYREALKTLDELQMNQPQSVRDLDLSYLAHSNLAGVLQVAGESEAAKKHYNVAIGGYKMLSNEFPAIPVYLAELARSQHGLGLLHHRMHRLGEAEETLRESADNWQKLVSAHKNQMEYRQDLARGLYDLADILVEQGKPAPAAKGFREACDHYEIVVHAGGQIKHRLRLAECRYSLGRTLGMIDPSKNLNDAERAFQDAQSLYAKLIAEDGPKSAYREGLAKCYGDLGALNSLTKRNGAAKVAYGRALPLWEELAKSPGKESSYGVFLAMSHASLGDILLRERAYAEAIAAFRSAIKADATQPDPYRMLSWTLSNATDVALRDPKEAIRLAEIGQKLAPKEGRFFVVLGMAHYRAGNWKEAVQALTQGAGATKSADCGLFLAMANWRAGEKDEARQVYEQIAQWMDSSGSGDEQLRLFRREAEEVLEIKKK